MFIGKGTEMIVVLRNNSYLIRKKRTFKDRRKEFIAAAKYHKTTYEKADPKIIKALRKKLLRERRKGVYKSIVIASPIFTSTHSSITKNTVVDYCSQSNTS